MSDLALLGILTVKRQMVSKLGDHDVGQQPCRRDALVDDLSRSRRLDQGLAVIEDPFATYMTFDGKHAGLVGELVTSLTTRLFSASCASFC